ncbi:hypothetical protein DRF59_02765 [Chryseobacterium flavum]|uniref:Beta-lactamase-related domain-containing protein n=3 Tax=Chryseobacterium flavum TaxID=415851 RepID=A0A3D9CSS5_9FLAO|nr:hypothetical protein DRF59_02765 [Chryseobacterium flavum]
MKAETFTGMISKDKKMTFNYLLRKIAPFGKPDSLLRMFRTCYVLLWILLPLAAASQSLQGKIDDLLKQEKLSGAVYSTIKDSHITSFSSGLKNLETGDPMLLDDKVHVGSLTKTFLAIGILRLATLNMLDLDDPIKKYLKDLPMDNPWESSNPVTIRHLLDHTSGMSDIRLWHFFSTGATAQTPLNEFYGRNPKVLDVHVKPGTMFSYSNIGYTLLGMLIDTIVKEPYEDYLDRNLLRPIGLKNSSFHFRTQHEDKKLAMGHFDNGDPAFAMPIYVRPAGQFTTTAEDMGTFLQFLLNGGRLNDQEFIKKEFIDQMGLPVNTIAAKNGLRLGYSLGALSRDRHGVVGIAHSGNTIGFRAMYYLFPKEKKAFFIAHNMDSETADYDLFNKTLIDHLDLDTLRVQIGSVKSSSSVQDSEWEGYYVPVFTKIHPMELIDVISGYTVVKNSGNGISIRPFQKKEIFAKTIGNALFVAQGRTAASHLFYKDGSGVTFLTTGTMTLKKISSWKIYLSTISVVLGVVAALLMILSFIINLFRRKWKYFMSPAMFCISTLILFTLSLLFVSSIDMIRIGNKSPPTMMIYACTFLLPAGCFISLIKYGSTLSKSIKRIDFWLIVLVSQFVITLWSYNLIPFATWE